MKKATAQKVMTITFLTLANLAALLGAAACETEIEYRDVIKEVAPRPTFKQTFKLVNVEPAIENHVKSIYNDMNDAEVIDLKYNYAGPIIIYGRPEDNRNTILLEWGMVTICGNVPSSEVKRLIKDAIAEHKAIDNNKLGMLYNRHAGVSVTSLI